MSRIQFISASYVRCTYTEETISTYGRPYPLFYRQPAALLVTWGGIIHPHSGRWALQLTRVARHFNSLAVLRIFQFYASDWIYCSMFHAMIVIDISTSRKREAVYSQYCLQRLQIAFAEAVRPEPPGGWSRPPEDIDDGRERDAEGLIDGSLCRVPESNRNAVEEDDVLDLDVIDPDVLDSTVQYDLG